MLNRFEIDNAINIPRSLVGSFRPCVDVDLIRLPKMLVVKSKSVNLTYVIVGIYARKKVS